MEIRIAISNLKWLKENINKIKKLNWGVEIQDLTIQQIISNKRVSDKIMKEYFTLIRNKPIKVSLHAPNIGLDPGSLNNFTFKLTKKRYYYSAKIASKLNADIIIFHSCIREDLNNKEFSEWLIKQQKIWTEVIKVLNNTKILFENVYEKDLSKTIALVKNLNNFFENRFGICFDIGHSLLHFKGKNFLSIIKRKEIEYIHVNYNNQKFDEHKPLPRKIFEELLRNIKNKKAILCLEYPLNKQKNKNENNSSS